MPFDTETARGVARHGRGPGRRRGNDLSGLGAEGLDGAAGGPLTGRRVLVAEDNVILSMHVADALERAGAMVEGPYPFANEALSALEGADIDAAVLDHELMDGTSGPVAERLGELGVPFAYFTSHERADLPDADAPLLPKPTGAETLVRTVSQLL